MVWWLSLLFGGIIVAEVPGLVKKKKWRELMVFSGLLFIGMVYGYGTALNYQLPNPLHLLEIVFAPVSQFLEKLLS